MKSKGFLTVILIGMGMFSLFLPLGTKPTLAADTGAPIFGYPSDTTEGDDLADIGGVSFDWWVSNGCVLSLERTPRGAQISTPEDCSGVGALSLPLPLGADITTCAFYREGDQGHPWVGGAFLGGDGRAYTILWVPPTPNGEWTISCTE